MKKRLAIVGMIFVLLSIHLVCAESETQQGTSSYQNVSNLIWRQYNEDFTYSSYILDEFVKNNISNQEAMINTVAVFTLTSELVVAVNLITPPEDYLDYHHYTLQSLINLKGYFWNLAKFYETGDTQYAIQSRERFNTSVDYRKKANAIKLPTESLSPEDLEAEIMENVILG